MPDLLLLAEAAAESPWFPDLLNLTGTGFAVWFGWYTTTVTIPNIVKDFRAELTLERTFHQQQFDRLMEKVEDGTCRHPGQSLGTKIT